MATNEPAVSEILNFRAVAPLRAAGGRLRPAALFRSGAFEAVSAETVAQLGKLGIKAVFDLRTEKEKARAPSSLLADPAFSVVSLPHNIRAGDLTTLLEDPDATADQIRATMARIYAEAPATFADVFALLFQTAARSGAPFVIHCTAGKDRTGIAVALLLDLLGVDRADILEDYLKTNEARAALDAKLGARIGAAGLGRIMPHLVDAMTACRPEYLDGMFDSIDRDFGGIRTYARISLRLDDRAVDTIAAHFVA